MSSYFPRLSLLKTWTGRFPTVTIFDGSAVALSGFCLIHCLLLPLAFAVMPSLAVILNVPESFHRLMILLALPIASIALAQGYRQHRQSGPVLYGVGGLFLLSSALLPGVDLLTETLLTVAGAILLATAHLKNWKMRRADK